MSMHKVYENLKAMPKFSTVNSLYKTSNISSAIKNLEKKIYLADTMDEKVSVLKNELAKYPPDYKEVLKVEFKNVLIKKIVLSIIGLIFSTILLRKSLKIKHDDYSYKLATILAGFTSIGLASLQLSEAINLISALQE